MLYTMVKDVPANTTEDDAEEAILGIAHGVITWVSVRWPPGTHRLAHCVILHSEHQLFPSTENMDLTGDEFPIEWTEHYAVTDEPYFLKVKMWNEDDTYPHELCVRVAVLPRTAVLALAVVDAIKSFLSLLSPKNIFTRKG